MFAGTCSDDKGVVRVEVSVKNLDTGVDYGKSLAKIAEDSLTWSISINKKTESGFELPDGNYQLEVTAWDKSGRKSGLGTRQFTIDNTPPVFVITKPGVDRNAYVTKNSLSRYGSLFSIEGTIADDHSISRMDVQVYDKNGQPVSSEPYTEKEISTTGGTSVTIARFIANGTDITNQRYDEVYKIGDEDSKGNKYYTCTVTVSDSTKQYTEPGDNGVEGGNSTSVVYLYDDLYKEYMSAKQGAGLSVNDFRSVLNGTATDASLAGKGVSTDVTVEKVRAALKKYEKDTTLVENNSLAFSLNPNADPTYNISGFSLVYNEAGTTISSNTNKAMGENPVTIIVNQGLDNVTIVPSSLKVYIKKIVDAEKAHITKLDLKASIDKLVDDVAALEIDLANAAESSDASKQKEAEAALSVVDGWNLLFDNSDSTDPSEATTTISIKLPGNSYIEPNAYYALVVTGHDMDNIKLSQADTFGFIGTVSAVPPSASFTAPKDLSYFANSKYIEGSETDKLVFTGTATENNAGMALREITATLTVSDESTGKELPDSIQVTIKGDSENHWTTDGGLSCVYDDEAHTNVWTFVPSLCGEDYQKIMAVTEGLMYLYNVKIKVTGTSALSYEMSRSVHIDTTKPVVQITSVSPLVSGKDYFGEDSEYKDYTFINSSITIRGSINEVNLENVTYDVRASVDLDADLSDAKYSVLEEIKDFYEKQGVENAIDGELGRISTLNKDIRTNLITDYFIATKKIAKDQPIKARIIFRAIDSVGNVGEYNSNESNGDKDFYIYQETNRPKITLGNADLSYKDGDSIKSLFVDAGGKNNLSYEHNLFGITNNNKLSLSFTDDDSLVEYEIYIAKDGEEFKKDENGKEIPSYTATPNKTSVSINYILPEKEGVYKVKILARDFIRSATNTDESEPYGINVIEPFYIAVDSGAPTISLSNPQNGTFLSRKNSSKIDIEGTVSKENVKITGFIYATDNASKKSLKELTVAKKSGKNGLYSWSGTIDIPEEKFGDKFILEVDAIDDYKQGAKASVSFGVDDTAPEWIEKLQENEENGKEVPVFLVNKSPYKSGTEHTWYKASSLPFEGRYKEQGSGIDHVEYTVIQAGETTGTTESFGTTKITDASGNFTGEESFSANLGEFSAKIDENTGSAIPNTVTFVAVDKAGNKSEEQTVEIYIDTEAPSLESFVTGSQFSNAVDAIEVTGTASDDSSGIARVILELYEDGNNTRKGDELPATSTAEAGQSAYATWKAEIPASRLTGLESTPHSVKAVVIDGANNKTTLTIFKINVDKDKPTISNISFTNTSEKYSVYQTEETVAGSTEKIATYYMHNDDGNKFSIYGSIMDQTSGIKKIELLEGTESRIPEPVASLPITNIDFAGRTGSANLTLKATDNAGNVTEFPLVVKFDNTPPKGIHAIDKSNKDIFFRISDLDNWKVSTDATTGETTGEIPAEIWNKDPNGTSHEGLDEDIGGKYSPTSFGKNETVRVRGNISDKESGVDMIYYKVISAGTDEIAQADATVDGKSVKGLVKIANEFLENYKNDNNGYFRANKIQEKRVAYTSIGDADKVYDTNGYPVLLCGTDGNGAGTIFEDLVKDFGVCYGQNTVTDSPKHYATVTTNYDNSFTGFKNGYNYLILVAVDNVGNASLDTVNVVYGGTTTPYSNFTLNVDTETPELQSVQSGQLLTNGSADLSLNGTFSDNFSGVKTVVIELVKNGTTKETVNSYTLNSDSAAPNSGFLTTSGAWGITINQTDLTALDTAVYSVKATVTDRAGNQWPQNIFTIQKDATPPVITNVKLSQTPVENTSYKSHKPKEDVDRYFVNPTGGKITIEGGATDNYGIKKIELEIPGYSGTIAPVDNSGTFSFTVDLKDLTGDGVTATLKVTDTAGNTLKLKDSSGNIIEGKKIELVFDKSSPEWDSTTVLKINDKEFNTTGANNWFKDTLLKFEGAYTELGSGIEKVTYEITKAGSSPSDTKVTGQFETTRSNTLETFIANLSGFTSKTGDTGENYNVVEFKAYDKVGNPSASHTVNIYLDMETPEIETAVTSNIITNGKLEDTTATDTTVVIGYTGEDAYDNYTIRGTVDDVTSGISSLSISANGLAGLTIDSTHTTYGTIKTWDADTEQNPNKKNWAVTLNKKFFKDAKSKLSANKKSINLSLTALDNAGEGNRMSESVATILFDTEKPVITLTSPTDAYTETKNIIEINGTISLKGTVTDDNTLPDNDETTENSNTIMAIEYSTSNAAAATWQPLTVTSITGNYTFTVSGFDTTQLTDEKTYYLRAKAVDIAGNIGYSPAVEVKVAQNTDRPIIKITNLANYEAWLKESVIKGTISDDDGAVTSFQIKNGSSDWDAVEVNSGSWSYHALGADGTKSLQFKVVDKMETEFVTASEEKFNNTTKFKRPYYLYDETEKTGYESASSTECGLSANAAISVRLDTAAPKIYTLGIDIAEDAAKLKTAKAVSEGINNTTINESSKAGGKLKYIKFYVPVSDAYLDKVEISIAAALSGDIERKYTTIEGSPKQFAAGVLELTKAIYTAEGASTATDVTIDVTDSETNTTTTYTYYESAPILVAEDAATELKTLKVTAYDQAKNSTPATANFYVDNTGPNKIVITSPAEGDEVTGTVNIVGTANDEGMAGLESIHWLIPPKGYGEIDSTKSNYRTDAQLSKLDGWTNSNNTSASATVWNFKFLAGSSTDLTVYDDKEKFDVEYNDAKNTYKIPVFFKAVDKLGNIYIKRDFYITHNPDADRPVTSLSYPTVNDYIGSNKYITLSGIFRANGTVEIPSGTSTVGKVFIQLGTITEDDNGNVTDENWAKDNSALANEFAALGGVVTPVNTGSEDNPKYTLTVGDKTYSTTSYLDNNWWGIPVTTKTSTWTVTLNSKGNLNPTGDVPTKIAIRACAINADGKMGLWTDSATEPIYIHVDNGAPSQSSVMRQYNITLAEGEKISAADAENASKIKLQKDYAAEMYLKGTWYLAVTLNDNESINKGSIKVSQGSSDITAKCTISPETESVDTYKIYIPIKTTDLNVSAVNYTVYVEDKSSPPNSSKMTYSFYIDNDAPVISPITAKSNTDFELAADSEKDIRDSNNTFVISGTIDDSGSGAERLVFYYLREGKIFGTNTNYSTACILDPLVTTGNAVATVPAASKISTTGLTTIPYDAHTLYAKAATGKVAKVTDTGNEDKYTFTDTSTPAVVNGNAHIHAGGLIYIGGDYGVIESVSTNVVTFKTNATLTIGEGVSASFPYAQVVDHDGESQANITVNPYSVNYDDGDRMIETFKKSGTTWTWDASLRTTNIPDGPCYLVVLAFDAAGNVSGAKYPVNVVNNRPRLAKLYLGTDLNSDESFANSEFAEYNAFDTNAASGITTEGYKESVTITTAAFKDSKDQPRQFTAKDKLAVVPEIVGGNNAVHLVYKRGATGTTAVQKPVTTTGSTTTSDLLDVVELAGNPTFTKMNTSTEFYKFLLDDDIVGDDSVTATNPKNSIGVSFTFWDETEERTVGTDTQYCVAYVSDLIINLSDATEPTVTIDPFYWNSLTENSIYGSESVASTTDLKGHIELEKDWESSDYYKKLTTKPTTGEYDLDPKVSGKIKITGTASDNKMLQSISIAVDGIKFDSTKAAGTSFTFATYNGSTWSRTKGGTSKVEGGLVEDIMIKDSEGHVTSTTKADGWKFEFVEGSEKFDQNGHEIQWILYLDTENHASVSDTDVKIIASATDFASKTKKDSDNPSDSSSTTQTGTKDSNNNIILTSYYRVDVVPYITGIKNKVGDAYKKDSSVFGRSATGAYPVYYYSDTNYETFTVNGFNFGSSPSVSVNGVTASEGTSVNVTSAMTSGGVVVTVGSGTNAVSSLNNVNNNNAKGSYDAESESGYDKYKNYYNRQPNNVNNSTLTDDCNVAVWNVKQVVSDTSITYPTMRVSTGAGNPYVFIYDSGKGQSDWASSAVKAYKSDYNNSQPFEIGYSYSQWFDTGAAIDKDGNIYGSSQNGDTGGDGNATYGGNYSNNIFFAKNTPSSGRTWAYDSTNYGYAIESGYYNGQFYPTRVRNPKIATDKNNALYMTYYDSASKEVRFRYGTGPGDRGFTNHGDSSSGTAYHTLASGNNAGEYTAVGATTDGKAIVVYYNSDKQGLYYTYNKTPTKKNSWSNAVEIDDNFVGWYVDLVVDGANGVHIAYYDASNGDLKYAYIQDYTKPNEVKTMTVDSYLSSGTNVSISVKNTGTATAPVYVPYISSFMSSFNKTSYTVRTAWITDGSLLKSKTADELKGVDGNDDFTGVWEVMTVPLASTSIPLDYSVGIGIKSNQPILGYGTQNGLETATLK